MNGFSLILADLQAAIAARAARDQRLAVLLVAVWGRIARMRTRLERLIAHWRAGTLPRPRTSRAGEKRVSVRTPSLLPTRAGWLPELVRDALAFRSQLEHLLSQEECVAFLAAVPQAGRIMRPLCRMLGIGVTVARMRKSNQMWNAPAPAVMPAGLVVGPDGRLMWI